MKNIRSIQIVFVLIAAGTTLASAQILQPTKLSAGAAAAGAEASPLATARAAVARVRSGAPEAARSFESVPVEFARVLFVVGYAGEVPKGIGPDSVAALNFKASYWSAQRTALQRRLVEIPRDERENREGVNARLDGLGNTRFDLKLSMEESARGGAELARLSSEKINVESDLRCVDAILSDVKADQAGIDGSEQILRRKAALMRSLGRL